MADKTSTLAKLEAARIAVEGIVVTVPPTEEPPVDPPQSDLAWYTSKAAGTITNMGTNVLQSKNPWPLITPDRPSGPGTGGFRAIMAASGGIWCPWRGAAGRFAIFGGGHADYPGNDVYELDIATQTYTQLKPPNWPLFSDAAGYHADGTDGEHWADATFTTTKQDQPSSAHNYGQLAAIPPNAQFPQGALITFGRCSLTTNGQRQGKRAHVYDFAIGAWRRFSTTTFPEGLAFGGACIDTKRNRAAVPSDRGMYTLDLATGVIGPKLCNWPSGVAHMVWNYVPEHDIYAGFTYRGGTPYFFWVVDAVTGAWTSPGMSGTWPTPGLYDGGTCWSELLGGLAHYHGKGESIVALIKPPTTGNVRTTPWPVTGVPFTGDTPVNDVLSGAGAHCRRFFEHKQAGGFIWQGATQQPAQFFKVTAASSGSGTGGGTTPPPAGNNITTLGLNFQ